MAKHFLKIEEILKQESVVELETKQRLGGFYSKAHKGINLLIQLVYSIPCIPRDETDESKYFSYVWNWFYMSIYTFRACILLLSRGYYFEASLLNRSLIEVLAKMHYFLNHKEELEKIENIEALRKGKSRMNFKKMFDEVFPGFYQRYRVDSHIAHGGIGARVMKIKYHSPTDVEADTGVFYNEWRAGSIVNTFIVYFLGYLRFYKKIFPTVIDELPSQVMKDYKEIDNWFERQIHAHIKLKGGENEWHKATRPIWDITR